MGSTSKQGWFLFAFIVGFTLGPAGLFGLGWLMALVGFAIMIGALVGFYSIKEKKPTTQNSLGLEHRPVTSGAQKQVR
jgi:hypothetical protein